jgi:hypothetical protein
MNIHIFYTHYNVEGRGNKYRPYFFDYETCFKNLLVTIKDKPHVKLNVIMDGKIEFNWINKYKEYYTAHEVEGGDMVKAGHAMFNLLKSIKDTIGNNDIIYILENDYLHVNNWVDKVTELFTTFNNLNYITLYDHNDKYTWMHLYEDLVSKIFVTNTHHWRTIPNTCGSYLCPKSIFFEDVDDQIREVGDANKWLWLEQNKGRFMLSALPGLSTHCMETLLSPTIDWEKINNEAKL